MDNITSQLCDNHDLQPDDFSLTQPGDQIKDNLSTPGPAKSHLKNKLAPNLQQLVSCYELFGSINFYVVI